MPPLPRRWALVVRRKTLAITMTTMVSLSLSSEAVSQDGSQTQSLSQGTQSQEDALSYQSDDDDLLDDADHDEVPNVAEVPCRGVLVLCC